MSGIFLTEDHWNFEETFDDKFERMKLDELKKNYPMFSNIEFVIKILKSEILIYSKDIVKEVGLYPNLFYNTKE